MKTVRCFACDNEIPRHEATVKYGPEFPGEDADWGWRHANWERCPASRR